MINRLRFLVMLTSHYVLLYYLGGTAGITAAGHAHNRFDWDGVVALAAGFLLVPFAAGLLEARADQYR